MGRFYINEGQLEPVYLKEEERKLITENMETSISKIAYEVYKSHQLTHKVTGKPSFELAKRMKEINQFQNKFGSYLRDKPQNFQKCQQSGLLLAKEIISKARDEVNQLCMKDLAEEIKIKETKIENMRSLELHRG